ncbi:Phosphatidylethanolamine-binding protein, partial [Rhizoctonia solani]
MPPSKYKKNFLFILGSEGVPPGFAHLIPSQSDSTFVDMPSLNPFDTVLEALNKEQIVPDVIPEGFIPSTLLNIAWGDKEAQLGNELTKGDTVNEPMITFAPGSDDGPDSTYTLAFLDPDAPSRADPKFGPFRHWVITGLRAPSADAITQLAKDNTTDAPIGAKSTKQATTPYRPPGPGPGTGVHRYVFLLFREPSEGFDIPPGSPEYGAELEQRRKWSGIEFGKRYGLHLVAANFFLLKAADQ